MKKLVLIPLILFLGSCGSSPSAQEVATQYISSITAADWPAACKLLSDKSRESLETLQGQSCPEALREQAGQWLRLGTKVTISGRQTGPDEAVFQTDAAKEPLLLRREDDGWQVTFFEKE